MYIQWFGQSFFKITAKKNQGDDVVIAINPFNKDCGLKSPTKFGADILLTNHENNKNKVIDSIKGTANTPEPFLISGPGEYEVKDIMIYGINSYCDNQQGAERGENCMYLLGIEDMWLAHLGDLGQKSLDNGQLESLRNVDILLLPVGGGNTLDAKTANHVVSQIEPRVIIPMLYKLPGLKENLDDIEKFIKESGLKTETPDNGKIKLVKKDLPQDDTKLIIPKI